MTQRSRTIVTGIVSLGITWTITYFATWLLGADVIGLFDFIANGARAGEPQAMSTYVFYGLLAIVATVLAVLGAPTPRDGVGVASDELNRKLRVVIALTQAAVTLAIIAYILIRPWQMRYIIDVHVPRSSPHSLVFFGTTLIVLLFFWMGNRRAAATGEGNASKISSWFGFMGSAPARVVVTAFGTAIITSIFALVLIPIAGYFLIGSDNSPEGLFGHVVYVLGGLICGVVLGSEAGGWVQAAAKTSLADWKARSLKAAVTVGATLTLLLVLGWMLIWSAGHSPTGYRVPDMASYTITFVVAILVGTTAALRLGRPETEPGRA